MLFTKEEFEIITTWRDRLSAITPDQVASVYEGWRGCQCGCRGQDTSDPVEIARILDIVKDDPDTELFETDTLHLAAGRKYFNVCLLGGPRNHERLEIPSGTHWDTTEARRQYQNDFGSGEDY